MWKISWPRAASSRFRRLRVRSSAVSRAQPDGRSGRCYETVYTTPAILEIHERLTELVRNHPESVELLAYHPGGRLEALDAIGAIASRPGTSVTAVAPGRPAAASFESVTGIETTALCDFRHRARGRASSWRPRRNVWVRGSSPRLSSRLSLVGAA